MISRLDPDRAVGEWIHDHLLEFDDLYFAARARLAAPGSPLDPELLAALMTTVRAEILARLASEQYF